MRRGELIGFRHLDEIDWFVTVCNPMTPFPDTPSVVDIQQTQRRNGTIFFQVIIFELKKND